MKISIITVVYNRAGTIERAIRSVLGQSYSNIEYIIIDGASTDGTAELVQQYKDRVHVIVSEKDKGMYDALNKGIRMATGDVVGILHADDEFASDLVVAKIKLYGIIHLQFSERNFLPGGLCRRIQRSFVTVVFLKNLVTTAQICKLQPTLICCCAFCVSINCLPYIFRRCW